jgi:hypothetical protein
MQFKIALQKGIKVSNLGQAHFLAGITSWMIIGHLSSLLRRQFKRLETRLIDLEAHADARKNEACYALRL